MSQDLQVLIPYKGHNYRLFLGASFVPDNPKYDWDVTLNNKQQMMPPAEVRLLTKPEEGKVQRVESFFVYTSPTLHPTLDEIVANFRARLEQCLEALHQSEHPRHTRQEVHELLNAIESTGRNCARLHVADDLLHAMIDNGQESYGPTLTELLRQVRDTPDPEVCSALIPKMFGLPVTWHAPETKVDPE